MRDGDRRRSRESLSSVKYECASDTGEDGSVDWNGVSTVIFFPFKKYVQ